MDFVDNELDSMSRTLEGRAAFANPGEFLQPGEFGRLRLQGRGLYDAILIFLQNWRAALIPTIAIPGSLVGTFTFMSAFGFSLDNLTLFGIVLAIGVVVDENVERTMREGLNARQAAHETMDEVGGALVALGLVLVAVFVPAAFLAGITGQFYRPFALTIAAATMISVLVSLTLSPALAAQLLDGAHRPNDENSWRARIFGPFNRGLERLSERYGGFVGSLVRRTKWVLVAYLGLIALAGVQFSVVPGGFIPAQDQGNVIVANELPPGAELPRTDAVTQDVTARLLAIEGVVSAVGFAGFSGATFTNASSFGTIFAALAPFDERDAAELDYHDLVDSMWRVARETTAARVLIIEPPPVRGIGNAVGYRMMVQDRRGRGFGILESTTREIVKAAGETEGLTGVFAIFNTGTPQFYLDIDRERARRLNVPISNVFDALEIYLGSAFVNDFNYLGRTFRVTAQADAPRRQNDTDLLSLRTRNTRGEAVPVGSVARIEYRAASYRVSGTTRIPQRPSTAAHRAARVRAKRSNPSSNSLEARGFPYSRSPRSSFFCFWPRSRRA